MALFRRRSSQAETAAPQGVTPEDQTSTTTGEGSPGSDASTTSGPHDVADRPDLDGRLDLGALRLRLVPGAQVSFATDPQRTVVHGVTLRTQDSLLFLELFAAPRTFGVWDEVREEMLTALAGQGATAEEASGPFGREIVARQVSRRPDGTTERIPTRLIGIDGPRWFVRATASGALGALAGAQRPLHALEEALADLVVVRDGSPRAPRTRIDLALPTGVRLTTNPGQGAPAPDRVAATAPDALPDADEVLRRGPEITETR